MKHTVDNSKLVESIQRFYTSKNISFEMTETDTQYVFTTTSSRNVYVIESAFSMYAKHEGYTRKVDDGYHKFGFTIEKVSNKVLFESIFDYKDCRVNHQSIDSVLFLDRKESASKLNYHGFVIPEYQRELVWSLEDEIKLIETLLKGNPIGMFIFNRVNENDYADTYIRVVDGQQRLNTIKRYINGDITDSHGRYYDDISSIEKRRFNNVDCAVVMFEDLPIDKEIEAYIASNDTGVNHTKDEIQKARDYLKM
jgi:hypothetical protein